jgi:enoyl-CoA hydratase
MEPYRYEYLDVSREGMVLRVLLNRPERLNATIRQMNKEMLEFFHAVSNDEEVRAVVISGAGRAFCAGGDLFEHDEFMGDEFEREMRIHTEMILAMLNCSKPIICAVNGAAVGWGATFALFGDIIIAGEKAQFSDPHVHLGLSTGDGAAIIWPQLMGLARAKQFLMTGEPIPAKLAYDFGLVNEVVADDALIPRAIELATKIGGFPSHAMRNTKASLNIPLKSLVQQMMDMCIALEVATQKSGEHHQALKDFAARRARRSAA